MKQNNLNPIVPAKSESVPAPIRQVLLGEPQRLALEWLFNGGSIADASQYAGVCRQTLSRWLNQDEDFKAAYEEWKIQTQSLTHARLLALSESATEAIANTIEQKQDGRLALQLLKQLGLLPKEK